MTLKEFAEKHGVPYHIVYGASYRVKPVATMQRDRDFLEKDLLDAVTAMLQERIGYHRQIIRKDQEMLERVTA